MMDSFSLQCEKDLMDDDSDNTNTRRPIISVAHMYDADAKRWGISIRGVEQHRMRKISDKLANKTDCKFRMVDDNIVFWAKVKHQLPSVDILCEIIQKCNYIPSYKTIYYKSYDEF